MTAYEPLYRRLLGEDYQHLPAELRLIHERGDRLRTTGVCEVTRGGNMLAPLIAGLFRFPRSGRNIPVEVTFLRQDDREIWVRKFDGKEMRTVQRLKHTPDGVLLIEEFGPFSFAMAAPANEEGLRLEPRGITFLGLPLPRWLLPRVEAHESVEDGRYCFDVRISLPLLGLLVSYHGQISPMESTSGPGAAKPHSSGNDGPIMLFDGVCNLCTAGVRFFMAHDPEGRIRYCAKQSEPGQAILRELNLPLTDFKTFVVLDGTDLRFRSDAVFHLVRHLPLPWRLLEVGRLVPRPLRDWLYDRVAGNRYRISGRRDICMIPPEAWKSRFL